MLRIRKIYERDDGATLEFIKVRSVPGFSHRVIINGVPRDWLGDHTTPNETNAVFFLDKHVPNRSNNAN